MAKVICPNPDCRMVSDVSEQHLGRKISCQHCQVIFVATKVGGGDKPSQIKTRLVSESSEEASDSGSEANGDTIEAMCPTCGAVFNLKADYQGKKVRCKKCENIFTVGGGKTTLKTGVQTQVATSKGDDEEEDTSSRKGRAVAKRGRDDDDDDDDDRSRRRRTTSKRGRDDDDDDDDDDRGRKRKRVYHGDDDDEDDDRPRRRAPRSEGGGAGKILVIVGGIIVLVLLVCGGGIYGIYRLADNDDNGDQAQGNGNAGNGGLFFPNGGGAPPPGFGFGRQPGDMAEALNFLRGNDPNDQREAANWLSHKPLDQGQQQEVATALEPLVKNGDDPTCAAGARALKVWGTKNNGPALTTALKARPDGGIPGEAQKDLMGALGHIKYEPGAEEILRFLPNFFVGGDAERALIDFGPGAEKPVLKYYFHQDGGVRAKARGLCVRYGTNALAILDQATIELDSPERGRSGAALEWFAKFDSQAAFQAAKADVARRKAVAVALNRQIDDGQANNDHVLDASKRWATKDNVAALIRKMERDFWNKNKVGDVLIAIGPACEPEVKQLLTHSDANVAKEAKRILNAIGSADSKFLAAIADLKSDDNGRIQEAARTLANSPVDEKQRAEVVAALLGSIKGDAFFQGNPCVEQIAKALAVWATKDDGAAVVDKLTPLKQPFLNGARALLIEWLGSKKVEKGIPFLVSRLTDRDEYQKASKALQAMGPELGSKIEIEVSKVSTNDHNQLAECFRVFGAVGTKKSLDFLNQQYKALVAKRDNQLAAVCLDAINAIKAR
jgi:predicted Zn finger-like uncharacterized protein